MLTPRIESTKRGPVAGPRGDSVFRLARLIIVEGQWRALRYILLGGLVVRLVLMPITSWGADTPNFILSNVGFLYRGSPYANSVLFNPPLGSYVQLPFFEVVSWFVSPQTLVQTFPALAGVASSTALVSVLIPSPLALIALKLPLIGSDLMVALLLAMLLCRLGLPAKKVTLSVALWVLNPLVIWASAVHGEVDTLAALAMVASLLLFASEEYFVAGVAVGLGIFAKLYPVVLIFLLLSALPSVTRGGRASSLRATGLILAGLGLSALPFVWFWRQILGLVSLQSGAAYGGVSILMMFNPGVYSQSSPWVDVLTPSLALGVHNVLQTLAVIGVVLGPLVLATRAFRPGARIPPLLLIGSVNFQLALGLGLISTVLAAPSPQSEIFVGLTPILILMISTGRSAITIPVAMVWGASFALYMSLATPLAYFYPLILRLGPGAVGWANGVIVGFASGPGGLRGLFWMASGVTGGTALLLLWGYCIYTIAPGLLWSGEYDEKSHV